jgi:hypothetical protein
LIEPIRRNCLELAQVHADARVAVDVDYELLRLSELRADRGGKTEAHRAHAARCHPEAWFAKIEVLRCPHLMLADARRDDRLALGDLVHRLDHVLRLDQFAVAVVVEPVRGFGVRIRRHAAKSR